MNEIQVTENNVVEGAAEAMESTSGKGWRTAGIVAGVAGIITLATVLIVKAVKAKKAQNAIDAPNDYETDEFVEAE